MLAKVLSSAVIGIDAYAVEVEVDIAAGLPVFSMVGLPEAAVKESKDRVKSAIKNSGYSFPDDRITVNLAPADIKKEGTGFDLPIALGLLAATRLIDQAALNGYLVLGELSLDGRVKAVNGALSTALAARDAGYAGIIVPVDNAREAAVVAGVAVIPVETLSQATEFLRGLATIAPYESESVQALLPEALAEVDFAEVKGQEHVKRALEVAAAGGHNLLIL